MWMLGLKGLNKSHCPAGTKKVAVVERCPVWRGGC